MNAHPYDWICSFTLFSAFSNSGDYTIPLLAIVILLAIIDGIQERSHLLNKFESSQKWPPMTVAHSRVFSQCTVHLAHIAPYSLCKGKFCHLHVQASIFLVHHCNLTGISTWDCSKKSNT